LVARLDVQDDDDAIAERTAVAARHLQLVTALRQLSYHQLARAAKELHVGSEVRARRGAVQDGTVDGGVQPAGIEEVVAVDIGVVT
jgi:hypothetical protein